MTTMPQPVPAPLAGPPRIGLLVASLVLRDALRWEQGYTFAPEACDAAGVADPCGSEPLLPTARPDVVENQPFIVWALDKCSTMGMDVDDYRARARRALEANESQQIAAEFWTGDLATTAAWASNQRLAAGADATTLGTGGDNPVRALALLEGGLAGQQGNRRGMIHCTIPTLTRWAAEQVVRREGTVWLTPSDHLVVADAGYPGTGPEAEAVAEDATWAFATGLVTVRLSDVMTSPDTVPQAIAHRVNDALFVAQRLASPSWDGCALVAVSIDLT